VPGKSTFLMIFALADVRVHRHTLSRFFVHTTCIASHLGQTGDAFYQCDGPLLAFHFMSFFISFHFISFSYHLLDVEISTGLDPLHVSLDGRELPLL